MVPTVSDVLTLETRSSRDALRTWPTDVRYLDEGKFGAALLLPNSFLAAWVVWRDRIPERWGFARDLRGRLLTRAIKRPTTALHQAEHDQALGEGLAITPGPRIAGVCIDERAIEQAQSLLSSEGLPHGRPFIVLAPGAAYRSAKQWLPGRRAELSAHVAQERAASVLVGAKA